MNVRLLKIAFASLLSMSLCGTRSRSLSRTQQIQLLFMRGHEQTPMPRRWVSGELLQFAPNNPITRGSRCGILWNLPGRHPFLVVLARITLDRDDTPPPRADRGT